MTTSLFADDRALVEKGKRVFYTNCISCHNRNPNLKGSIGPELIDAPLEIMQIKVITGRYPDVFPANFIAKRKTKAMKAFPMLKNDVPAIFAFIQSVKNK